MIVLFLTVLSLGSILNQPELNRAQFGICVLDLDRDSVIYAQNSQKLLIPASNMKIITTGASLYYLGPEYRFKTHLAMRGKIKKNKLYGDIIIRGGGDPTLGIENMEQFIYSIKEKNIKEITGNIIVDDSYFNVVVDYKDFPFYERLPVGWAWHYLDARYAPEISALSLNKNCVTVKIVATELGDYADVSIEPETDYVALVNNIRTKNGDDSIIIYRKPEVNVIHVEGGIGRGHKKDIDVAVKDPALFAGHYFKERLSDEHIKIDGKVLQWSDSSYSVGEGSHNEIIIDSVISVPLIDILRETGIESVNLYAEILLKTLGVRFSNEGSFHSGIQVLKRFLDMCGVDTSGVSLWDGSGLSRHNLISPYHVTLVLRFMYQSKLFDTFYGLLPSSGEGTLENRFNDFEATMRAKTGTLHAVSCISGYVTINETVYCFSMMFNNFTCSRKTIEEMQEQVLKKLVEYMRDSQ